ncbi:MAG: hypothetical protein CBB87_05115 [Micavibrio sp. TMED27]|nr:hypothetical protein [Micavibrio sp.]OUT91409.1 MAG: hypothetical protein CBB87_05115 [Micavibrio sp. TMED27]|tara:strand:+ start:248 stop:637 length:390 start_codon:yes stop_codon:yes gene_type:complete
MNELSLEELRGRWTEAWGKRPHGTMGRRMMLKSLEFKQREKEADGLSPERQNRLDELVKSYKRNPDGFDKTAQLKPGTRLVRVYNGKKHSVLVKANGFEYEGETYTSLSKIANEITGSRWNGWLFFGLK